MIRAPPRIGIFPIPISFLPGKEGSGVHFGIYLGYTRFPATPSTNNQRREESPPPHGSFPVEVASKMILRGHMRALGGWSCYQVNKTKQLSAPSRSSLGILKVSEEEFPERAWMNKFHSGLFYLHRKSYQSHTLFKTRMKADRCVLPS